MVKRIIRLGTALGLLGLTACSNGMDIKETLGLNHKGPDAMEVYSRPPLTVPPEFDLQAPGKGSEYSIGVPAEVQAHNEILGTSGDTANKPLPGTNILGTLGPASTAVSPVSSSALPSNGDAQFLANVGATKADPNVREEIEKEKNTPVTPKDDHYFWGGKSSSEPTVDSTKEAQRLKDDKAQDKPPTTGETPVVVPKDRGLLGTIF